MTYASSTRINLAVPLDIVIQIEKECEIRGINRTQFIKEAINDKLKNKSTDETTESLEGLSKNILEMKQILVLLLDSYSLSKDLK